MRPNASQLNSSEGFKRRLIRPTSSRAGDRNQQFLKMFDIAQNESTIAAIAKADLLALQEDINSIDLDKKIRGDELTLSKNYITTVKKWVKEVQNFQHSQDDEGRILKALNVDNLQSGFKKLWKITQYLDSLLLKNNELNAIVFLKYDELFTSLTEGNINPTTKKLNLIGQGFSASSVQMSSVYIERLQDLYSLLTKSKKDQKQTTSKLKLKEKKQESTKLIAQLQEQNRKLNKYLEEMTKENQLQSQIKAMEIKQQPVEVSKQDRQTVVKVDRSDLDIAVSQISSSYQQQIEDFSAKLKRALDSESHLKLEIRGYKQTLESKKDAKQNKPASSSHTYEATLKEQLDSMKKGYQNKISKLKQDYSNRERQLMRKQNEYRVQNEKIKFQRQLLMKKYDLTK